MTALMLAHCSRNDITLPRNTRLPYKILLFDARMDAELKMFDRPANIMRKKREKGNRNNNYYQSAAE